MFGMILCSSNVTGKYRDSCSADLGGAAERQRLRSLRKPVGGESLSPVRHATPNEEDAIPNEQDQRLIQISSDQMTRLTRADDQRLVKQNDRADVRSRQPGSGQLKDGGGDGCRWSSEFEPAAFSGANIVSIGQKFLFAGLIVHSNVAGVTTDQLPSAGGAFEG